MGWSTHHPVGLIYSAPQQCYRGYTLVITTRGNYHANLIDMEGLVCHRWYSPEGINYGYLLPNGHLLLRTGPQQTGTSPALGASAAGILELDWESNVVWECRLPMLHHDFQRLPNGNTLICEGAPGRIFEVTSGKEMVWEYINPFMVEKAADAGTSPSIYPNALFRATVTGRTIPGCGAMIWTPPVTPI